MGLISKLKPRSRNVEAPPSLAEDLASVSQVRTAARRRLIGASILLMVGIIGFPLLLETQPRPIPVDIPILIPARDGLPPLETPSARISRADPALQPPPVEAPPVDLAASRQTATPPTAAPAASNGGKPPAAQTTHDLPAPKPVPEAPVPSKVVAPEPRPAAETRPRPATETRPVESKSPEAKSTEPKAPESKPGSTEKRTSAPDDLRFVVQVGAFTEAAGVRDARAKVEALGLKTYTQVVEAADGRRIRVRAGPFGSKQEAQAAAAKIKATGLPTAVLQL